jgi:hypothetical protein
MKLMMIAVLTLAGQMAMATPPPTSCIAMATQVAKGVEDISVAPAYADQEKVSIPAVRSIKSFQLEGVSRWTIDIGFPITITDKYDNVNTFDVDMMSITLAQNGPDDCYFVRAINSGAKQ